MTEREEIDMLRRLVADLTERVRTLETRPASPVYVPLGPGAPQPYVPPAMPWAWPFIPPVTCGDPMPMRPMTTCVGGDQPGGATVQRWG